MPIFYPCMTYNLDEERASNHYNCPVVAYYPELLKANVAALADFDFMMPYFELADKKRFTKHAVKYFCGKYPQIKKKQVIAAVEEAYLAQDEYYIDVRIEVSAPSATRTSTTLTLPLLQAVRITLTRRSTTASTS